MAAASIEPLEPFVLGLMAEASDPPAVAGNAVVGGAASHFAHQRAPLFFHRVVPVVAHPVAQGLELPGEPVARGAAFDDGFPFAGVAPVMGEPEEVELPRCLLRAVGWLRVVFVVVFLWLRVPLWRWFELHQPGLFGPVDDLVCESDF